MSSFYEILGLEKGASFAEIKAAYKKMAQKYHPDKNKDEGSQHLFASIKKAYDVLSDPKKRARYDSGESVFEIDVTKKAVELVASGIAAYIRAAIDGGNDIKFSEIYNHCSEQYVQKKRELYQINSRIKKMDKLAGKVKIKDHENLYNNVFEDIRAGMVGERKTIEEDIMINSKVLEILKGATETENVDIVQFLTNIAEG